IEHRDSAGHHAVVRPGELNLMTAGRGISHSEYSTAGTTRLHGAQLWLALPDSARHTDPTFEHFAPEPVSGEGWEARVFLVSPLGERIVMWWNFIGRDHDEVAAYREQWQHLVDAGSDDRFALPADDPLPPLPAPVLPNSRMLSRG